MRFLIFSILLISSNIAHAQRIAAASDVQPILDPLVAQFNAQNNAHADVIYGSSGKLAQQIEAGAPFALFLSADAFWIEKLRRRYPRQPVVEYARGRLALVARRGNPMCQRGVSALADAQGKFAIAHPEHAPYGMRAREVLQRAGVWDGARKAQQIVEAESVATAAHWVISGAASAGLIGWTHTAKIPAAQFCVQKVPFAQHSPLVQQAILLTEDVAAKSFWVWFSAPQVLENFARAGLTHD